MATPDELGWPIVTDGDSSRLADHEGYELRG